MFAATVAWVGAVFGFVYWLNRRAVKRQLQSHREGIAALVRQLDANGAGEGM